MKKRRQFSRDRSGATAIEYALLAALIAMVAIDSFNAVGTNLSTEFTNIADMLNDAYNQTFTTTTGTVMSNGVPVTYTTTTSVNADGSVSSRTVDTDPSGNVSVYTATTTYGSNGTYTQTGTSSVNGVTNDTFSLTASSPTSGTETYTNTNGQSTTYDYSISNNVVTYTNTSNGAISTNAYGASSSSSTTDTF